MLPLCGPSFYLRFRFIILVLLPAPCPNFSSIRLHALPDGTQHLRKYSSETNVFVEAICFAVKAFSAQSTVAARCPHRDAGIGEFDLFHRSERLLGLSSPTSAPSYRQILVTAGRSGGGGYGLRVGRLGDDLNPVVECHTKNEFWQLVVSVETTSAFLRALEQFEDHGERRPVGQAYRDLHHTRYLVAEQ
jgi:hypothetical protein